MEYKSITERILIKTNEGKKLVQDLILANNQLHTDEGKVLDKSAEIIAGSQKLYNNWISSCEELLKIEGMIIELGQFINFQHSPIAYDRFNHELGNMRVSIQERNQLLLSFAEKIEAKQSEKEIIPLTIDDFDNFEEIKQVSPKEVIEFAHSAFLEDDVEESFLGALGEPYKELDSGSESRDLFTNRIKHKGKRFNTVFMFKGRSVKGVLKLKDCGDTGNQLLKLSRNLAECYIVQHGNKIDPDVMETLRDHLLSKCPFKKIYVCYIDGVDTARFLKSQGKDLTELMNKKFRSNKKK